jgi:hypothetical protein
MSDPVEAVARALASADGREPDELRAGNVPYGNDDDALVEPDGYMFSGDVGHFVWRRYVPKAHAAIAAYREALEADGWQVVPKVPTHDMLKAAENPLVTSSRLSALTHDYTNMLSAALIPKE